MIYILTQVMLLGDHPKLNHLKHIIRNEQGVTAKWYDIGLELLDNDTVALDNIKMNYQSDVDERCTEMFKKWLEKTPDAKWNQLVRALKKVGLIAAAYNIKKGKFMSMN